MTDAEKAAEFRRKAENLLLKASNDHDSRFIFRLEHGDLVVPRHPTTVRQLVELAEAYYGEDEGEHLELMVLCAERAEVHPSSMGREVIWKETAAFDERVHIDLETWLDDQFSLEQAIETIGLPFPLKKA